MADNKNSRRIAIFVSRLSGGGAERAMIFLANRFAALGHETDLVLLRREGPYLDLLDPDIRVVDLAVSRMLFALPALRRYRAAKRPDVIMSAQFHADQALLLGKLLFGWPVRIVPSVQVSLSGTFQQSASRRERLFRHTLRLLYPWSDHMVAISSGLAHELHELFNIPEHAVTVIHNPVVTPNFEDLLGEEISHDWINMDGPPVILAMGRLTRQKDFPTLIRAFSLLRRNSQYRLLILGEGEDRGKLERLVSELGLEADIQMPGFVNNPYPWLKKADVFVLSSLWEGFANVVAEALACGTPVVSTDCPHGPREILDQGRFGRLVPVDDPEALAVAIEATLNTHSDQDALRNRGYDFRIEPIADQYLEVLFPNPGSPS